MKIICVSSVISNFWWISYFLLALLKDEVKISARKLGSWSGLVFWGLPHRFRFYFSLSLSLYVFMLWFILFQVFWGLTLIDFIFLSLSLSVFMLWFIFLLQDFKNNKIRESLLISQYFPEPTRCLFRLESLLKSVFLFFSFSFMRAYVLGFEITIAFQTFTETKSFIVHYIHTLSAIGRTFYIQPGTGETVGLAEHVWYIIYFIITKGYMFKPY